MSIRSFILAAALALPAAANAEVTLINVFELPPAQKDAALSAWNAARDFLAQQPGYIDTQLYVSLSPQSRFQLINVAHWASADDFAAATRNMRAAKAFPPVPGLAITPALYAPYDPDQ